MTKTSPKARIGIAQAACLILLTALVALRIWDPPPIEELRLRTFDLYQMVKPRTAQQRPAVILDVDEASLRELGQWPWPRTLIAEIVDRLTRHGARVIGFDVIFSEPDRLSPANVAETRQEIDEDTRTKLRLLPSNDSVLADAMRRSRVVLGHAGASEPMPQPDDEAIPRAGFAMRGPDPSPFLVAFRGVLRSIPILEESAAGRGLVTIRPEQDGVVRRVPLVMVGEGDILPAFALEVLRVAAGAQAVLIRSDEAGVDAIAIPGLEIPTDRNGRLWIHFSPHDPTRYVSAIDLLHDRVPPERLAGRLVLVGTSATGLLDLKTTPVDPAMPGVEVNAQILENMLTGASLWRPNFSIGTELSGAVVLGLATIIVTPIMGARAAFVLGVVNTILLTGVSWWLYLRYKMLIDYTYPLLSTTVLYFTLVFVNYFREEGQRKQIRLAFAHYLSPALVEELARHPEQLVLGGEERKMTILFSDVRGFTTMSERYKNNPQGLTSLMNRYLTPMTDTIIAHKGTIDKYIGDAIMAFWNAPLDDVDQESNSCAAALDMLARLEQLNSDLAREAVEASQPHLPFRIGIGINTGQCVVGNMGSDFRFDYSVLGDCVNLASRLEGRSKDYGVPIVLGSSTAVVACREFATIEIDLIQVKGKNEPEAVYTMLGRQHIAQSMRFAELQEVHGRMLAQYRSRKWTEALESIDLCRKAADGFSLGTLYDTYVQRIALFRGKPPPPDWNGVFVFDTK